MKDKKQGYFKWVFTNRWYYFLPILWVILGILVFVFKGNISSYAIPKNISFSSLILTIITYYLYWQIPFFIYWVIKVRKR